MLLRSIYVDDVVSRAASEEKAYELYTISKQLLCEGGFNLHKFMTNLPALREKITHYISLKSMQMKLTQHQHLGRHK